MMGRGRRALAVLALTFTGCSDRATPVAAYRHFDDKMLAMTGGVFGYPCTQATGRGEKQILESTPFEDCYRLQPPRRYHGVWIDEFEGSRFLINAQQAPKVLRYDNDPRIWLRIDPRALGAFKTDDNQRRAYLIDFIGRKTLVDGRYGHMGASSSLILADKVLSISPITPPAGTESCDDTACTRTN